MKSEARNERDEGPSTEGDSVNEERDDKRPAHFTHYPHSSRPRRLRSAADTRRMEEGNERSEVSGNMTEQTLSGKGNLIFEVVTRMNRP